MDLLEIKTAGDPVLKTICAPVEKIDKRLRNLLDKMAETMYAHEGVGIAAPQVGVSIRACVVDVDRKTRYDLINPVITLREGSVVDNEGCLSCPDLFGDVERAEKIRVEFINRFGKKKILARQASARGGILHCEISGERVKVSGNAALFATADLNI